MTKEWWDIKDKVLPHPREMALLYQTWALPTDTAPFRRQDIGYFSMTKLPALTRGCLNEQAAVARVTPTAEQTRGMLQCRLSLEARLGQFEKDGLPRDGAGNVIEEHAARLTWRPNTEVRDEREEG